MHRLAERIDERVNPIMLKEVYQAFRSRALFGGALMALSVPLVTYMVLLGTSWLESFSSDAAGKGFLVIVATCMAIVTCAMFPVAAGMQLQAEVRSRTLDLIALTALTPWQIASGRFQATLVQTLLVFAYMGPFAVAAVAMGGIGIAEVLGWLLAILLVATLQAATSLFLASIVVFNTRARGLGWVLFGAQLWFLLTIGVFAVESSRGVELEAIAWLVSLALALTFLFLRLTADALTPPGTRCYAPSKLALLPVVVLLWLSGLGTTSRSDHEALFALSLCVVYFFSTLWGGSRRTAGDARFPYPLRNGYDSTLVYATVITAAATAIGVSLTSMRWWVLPPFFVYYVFFTGLAVLGHSLLPRARRTAETYYAMLLGVVVWNVFASGMVEAATGFDFGSKTLPGWYVLMPLTLRARGSVPEVWFALPVLIGFGALWLARRRNARLA